MKGTLTHFLHLIRFYHPSGTLLLLFPSLWALVLSSHGFPSPLLVGIFTLGAFLMRSAGVIVNDLADRTFDAQVSRTQTRPLASGMLRPSQATFLAVLLVLLAAGLLSFLPPLTILLSPIAVILAILYPFTKRFFYVPQFFLGLAFGWGAIMAWSATQNSLAVEAWLIFGATIFWAIGYDTIYALQDQQDDLRIGIHSSAILFGQHIHGAVALAFAGTLVLLGLAGWLQHLHHTFYVILAGVTGFFIFQTWKLKYPVSPTTASHMFKQHVWVGMAILIGFWMGCL